MKIIGKNISLVLLILFLVPTGADALPASEIFKRYSPSVATLVVTTKNGKKQQGTGFLVSPSELLTNYHVIDGAASVAAHFSPNAIFGAKRILAQDPDKDLALLWIENIRPPIRHLGLSAMALSEGSDIVVIGTPVGLEKTISTGIVSGYRQRNGATLVQISAPVSSGSSGSPVFDANGRVVGIVMGGIRNAQGVNFAVSVKDVIEFIRTKPLKASAAPSQAGAERRADGLRQSKAPQFLALASIQAKLNQTRPGLSIEIAQKNMGKPDQTEERNTNYFRHLWSFQDNGAVLFVWDRNGIVERSEWLELHPTKNDAAIRAKSVTDLAAAQYGKPTSKSQTGCGWKLTDYQFGIEQHNYREAYSVVFKMTK